MSDAKHTPAPWHWSNQYPSSDGSKTWSLIGANGYGILSCDGLGNSPQGLGDETNARLIAAAPKLLEALKSASSVLGDLLQKIPLHECADMIVDEALKIEAAISKAEGK